MSIILCIETATRACSVALGIHNEIISFRRTMAQNAHSAELTAFIDEVMKEAGIALSQLDAIAVSKGPGSYTGLRIGVSSAKGLCYALDKPLIGVSTLQLMAHAIAQKFPDISLFCPMIDARRMEVYNAIFDQHNVMLQPVSATIIEDNHYAELLSSQRVAFFGDGSEKCKNLIKHENAVFIPNVFPDAVDMITIAFNQYLQGQLEDVAYFEPFYLKDFIAGKPHIKGLR